MLSCTRVMALVLSIAAPVIVPALAEDAAVERKTRTYALSGLSDLILSVPESWQETVQAPTSQDGVVELKLRYESEKPLGWSFVINALWNPDKRTPALAEELRADAERIGKQYRGRVVEPQISIHEDRGDDVLLYYFSVTDTERRPDEYVYMTQGVARIGHVLAAFAILSNGERVAIERQALEVLRTAAHEWRDDP